MRGVAHQGCGSCNGINGTYSISIPSMSEVRVRKGALGIPILGRIYHHSLVITLNYQNEQVITCGWR